ncbi:hypothetical protein J4X96_28460, partial [Escherichia coli]
AARLCENEAVELDVSGPKPRLTISPLASLDEPDSLKRLSKMIGSVAKIVKLEHAWRRLDGRNDDGFQVAPFPG